MNDTPPRAVLSLKKAPNTPAPLPEKPPQSPKKCSTKKQKNAPPAFASLQKHWPTLFNRKHPTPLKIGITAAIVDHFIQAEEPYSTQQIENAIKWFCNRNLYLKALSNAPHRVGLQGELSPISEQDSKGALSKFKARIRDAKVRALEKKL